MACDKKIWEKVVWEEEEMKHQINFFDEIIVDNFAGGGGASTGIELATGLPVTIAINHDPSAILMHQTNHPYTMHLQDNVWNINPVEICSGRPVGLAWFSPDCKHFSKAKGAALVDRNIRGLAWIVLKWAGTVKPRVIILENVEEFKTWGPVRKGKPIKSKTGQTFDKWLGQLKDLGYDVEYRELVAADYGAPTTRKRFFLIARCDGKPIVWPERTHAPSDSEEVKTGKYKPWISAAEIIDWSLPCPSIFASSEEIKKEYGLRAMRPLKDNTMRRIARGMDKFVIKNQKPFIIPVGYGERQGQKPRIHNIEKPLGTIVSTVKHHVVSPEITPYILSHKFNNNPETIRQPLSTITAVNDHELVTPTLIQYHSEQSEKEVRASGVENPIMTVDGSNRYGVAVAHLTQYFKGDHYHSPEEPLHTVTTEIREGVTLGYLTEYYGNAQDGINVNKPMRTITTKDKEAVAMAHITEFKGQDIGQDLKKPLRTITTSVGEFGTVYTRLEKINGCNDLKHWSEIRDMLNRYCGYNIAEDEILLLNIDGIDWFISDIGLRMLTPKELYAAQGFPKDYIIDHDYMGNEYKKKYQVARCGNAVCPQVAKALVKANMPEYCIIDFSTMLALKKHMA